MLFLLGEEVAAGTAAAAGSGAGAAAPTSLAPSTMSTLLRPQPPAFAAVVLGSHVVVLDHQSARQELGHGETTGSWHQLDVLVIGGQDGLQVLGEPPELHLGIFVHHRALAGVLKCSSVNNVLGWN